MCVNNTPEEGHDPLGWPHNIFFFQSSCEVPPSPTNTSIPLTNAIQSDYFDENSEDDPVFQRFIERYIKETDYVPKHDFEDLLEPTPIREQPISPACLKERTCEMKRHHCQQLSLLQQLDSLNFSECSIAGERDIDQCNMPEANFFGDCATADRTNGFSTLCLEDEASRDDTIETEHPNLNIDVICARGRRFYNYPGCERFRAIIDECIPQYMSAATKVDKSILIDVVIDKVTDREGEHVRFFMFSKNRFIAMENDHIRDKVGHALRSAAQHKDW